MLGNGHRLGRESHTESHPGIGLNIKVCVGDTDGDGGAASGGSVDGPFFLGFLWGGCLAGSWD